MGIGQATDKKEDYVVQNGKKKYDLQHLFTGSITQEGFNAIKKKLEDCLRLTSPATYFLTRLYWFGKYCKNGITDKLSLHTENQKNGAYKEVLGFVFEFNENVDIYSGINNIRCLNGACVELLESVYTKEDYENEFLNKLARKLYECKTDDHFSDILKLIQDFSKSGSVHAKAIIEILNDNLLKPLCIKVFFDAENEKNHEIQEMVDLYELFKGYNTTNNDLSLAQYYILLPDDNFWSLVFFPIDSIYLMENVKSQVPEEEVNMRSEQFYEIFKKKFKILADKGGPQLLDISALQPILDGDSEDDKAVVKQFLSVLSSLKKLQVGVVPKIINIRTEGGIVASDAIKNLCNTIVQDAGFTIIFETVESKRGVVEIKSQKFSFNSVKNRWTYAFAGLVTCIGIWIFFKHHFKKFSQRSLSAHLNE